MDLKVSDVPATDPISHAWTCDELLNRPKPAAADGRFDLSLDQAYRACIERRALLFLRQQAKENPEKFSQGFLRLLQKLLRKNQEEVIYRLSLSYILYQALKNPDFVFNAFYKH